MCTLSFCFWFCIWSHCFRSLGIFQHNLFFMCVNSVKKLLFETGSRVTAAAAVAAALQWTGTYWYFLERSVACVHVCVCVCACVRAWKREREMYIVQTIAMLNDFNFKFPFVLSPVVRSRFLSLTPCDFIQCTKHIDVLSSSFLSLRYINGVCARVYSRKIKRNPFYTCWN